MSAESIPCAPAINARAAPRGKSENSRQFGLANPICAAISNNPPPKMISSTSVFANPATAAPRIAPSEIQGVHDFKTPTSTAPAFMCVESERHDVEMMVESEVPTATCMRIASSTPSAVNTK